jgi:hypothetical protein
MFELLLQADKALAGGLLDQAEKTYWQLIDLDPTNSIAVAGLARVAMERGNEGMARDFAERALGIDPDSILARRVLDAIEHRTTAPTGHEPPELPLLAMEQLEAVGRRRGKTDAAGAAARTRTPDVAKLVAAVEPAAAEPVAVKLAAIEPAAAEPKPVAKTATILAPALAMKASPVHTVKGARARVAPIVSPASSRGKTTPDQIGPLPSEPLAERRQAGRLAAAAAAAAAAARAPVHPRHNQPHPQPVGKYHVALGTLKAPPPDEYSAAEMAAAVAAVDALDDGSSLLSMAAAEAEAETAAASYDYNLLGGVDAEEDSVAMRIALLGGDLDLEAAEREAAQFADETSDDFFEAAEAAAGPIPREMAASRIHRADTDEFAAAEAEAEAAEPDFGNADADADAAEAEAAAEALHEVASAAAGDHEPAPARHRMEPVADGEPSEEAAEAQALREAMAIVLSGEGEAGAGEAAAEPTAHAEPAAEPIPELIPEPIPKPAGEPPAESPEPPSDRQGDVAPEPDGPEQKSAAEPPGDGNSMPKTQPHKSGLFHRIRGN